MRGILVDHVRARQAAKRGGGAVHLPLDERLVISPKHDADLGALDEALRQLASFDARKSRVVELRFFGGLTVEETADVLGISADSVRRDWRLARMWLMRQLEMAVPDHAGGVATN
jgi:RNA polymerase sigma factor (TIGR02999 family)